MSRIFPKLKQGQFALSMADSNTGHALTINGKVSLNLKDQIFKIFESIEEAHKHIQEVKQSQTSVEFYIYNWKQEFIELIKAE